MVPDIYNWLQSEDAGDDNIHRPMFSAVTTKSHAIDGAPSASLAAGTTERQGPISEAELVPMGGMPVIPYAVSCSSCS